MFDVIDKQLLKAVADLEGIPKGAYNIRKNGKLLKREVSANINIESNAEGTGIIITIKPGTINESVHIPVILSQAGLYDVVYNTFIVGENSDVTIVAGCGIHCGGKEREGHAGIHEFKIGKNAKLKYVEKHVALGEGRGKRILNPTTKVFLEEGGIKTEERYSNSKTSDIFPFSQRMRLLKFYKNFMMLKLWNSLLNLLL